MIAFLPFAGDFSAPADQMNMFPSRFDVVFRGLDVTIFFPVM